MWETLGVCGTVGDLMDILGYLPRDLSISAAGGDCYVLYNGEDYVVLDEKDYSAEWNEENEL